jgi:hypothetical protein
MRSRYVPKHLLFSSALAFVALTVLALAEICYGQSPQDMAKTPSAMKDDSFIMAENEGANVRATWSFHGPSGDGEWESGQVAGLDFQEVTPNKDGSFLIRIHREDTRGSSSPGLIVDYTGVGKDGNFGGSYTSSWPGHWENKTGSWRASIQRPISLPEIMHFCAKNCLTLQLKNDQYEVVTKPNFCPTDWNSIWRVRNLTTELIILRRHDAPCPANPASIPNGIDAVYTGRISREGNSLIFDKAEYSPDDASAPSVNCLRLVWGAALDSVPGNKLGWACGGTAGTPLQPGVGEITPHDEIQFATAVLRVLEEYFRKK